MFIPQLLPHLNCEQFYIHMYVVRSVPLNIRENKTLFFNPGLTCTWDDLNLDNKYNNKQDYVIVILLPLADL